MRDGVLYRQINPVYFPEFDRLVESGLYEELTDLGLLIPHELADIPVPPGARAIRPERLSMISYPYEWCFGQLRDAALATLKIQKTALAKGMSLKDATAYNVQFRCGKPLLIDTLSFETYVEGRPWSAYGQFCRHFVAPLLMMCRTDVRLHRLARGYVDGVPLDLAAKLVPWRTRLNPHILAHLHLHAKAQTGPKGRQAVDGRVGKTGLLGIVDSLESLVKGLKWEPKGTEWADYYDDTNYSDDAMRAKTDLVQRYLDAMEPQPASAWDLGANDGRFSMIVAKRGIPTVAWDLDVAAVEKCYRRAGESDLLPLVQDLANPSPGIGWAHHERQSLVERGPADAVFALALVHHLAIGNNVPLPEIAAFLADIGRKLVIEFVPKEDSQVQRLLLNRADVFPGYTQLGFEEAFAGFFETIRRDAVPGTRRTLYLMTRRERA
jgi:hypothetical protein